MNFVAGLSGATASYNNEFKAVINTVSENTWDVQLNHPLSVTQGTTYTICFDVKAESARSISYNIDTGPDKYEGLIKNTPINITTDYQSIKYTFAAEISDSTTRLTFNMGQSDVDVYLDNIGVFEGNNCGSFAAAPLAGTPPVALTASTLTGNLANGETSYKTCAGCHGVSGAGGSAPAINSNKVVFTKNATAYSLESYIAAFMPKDATACSGQCAADVAAFIKAGFTVPSKNNCAAGAGVVCEDFEENTLNSRWKSEGSAGNVTLTTEEKFSGTKSLKVLGAGAGYNANGITLDLSQLTSLTKNHYGRAMLKTPAVSGNAGDFTFIEASGPANLLATTRLTESNRAAYRARVDGAHESFMANYDTSPYGAPLTDCYSHADFVAVPKDTWACFEWRFDATTNTLAYWLNGTKLGMSVKDRVSANANCAGHVLDDIWSGPSVFDKLHIGIDQYHNTSKPRTVYIDDVIVDAERVKCPQQ